MFNRYHVHYRDLLLKSGLSQMVIAEKVGASQCTVSNWLRDKHPINANYFDAIEKLYKEVEIAHV